MHFMSAEKVGAVLVVGAGIAGIQASLDLAESGYYVYLVEQSPATGGTMPMLDKTFPTNDCSMCILSPKLVECGRHLNVKTITCADVMNIQGEPGNFTATIKQRPRYVDLDKCTGCGDCATACPVELPSDFNGGFSKRKAIYKLYAQAMPSAFAIEKNDLPPCRAACPAGINVQGYVQLVKKGKMLESWQMIYNDNPLPGICGRVCTHPCEVACHRGEVDSPVSIRELKRLAADAAYRNLDELPLPDVAEPIGQKVAVIGAGPAGLSAAYQLVKKGYGVTIFEALPVAGGMLSVGIPAYRLPKELVNLEVSLLQKMGVEIKTGVRLGTDFTIADLKEQGYGAILLAIGAHKGISLQLPGEDLDGVMPGVDFLRNVNLGEDVKVGKHVAVIGGGNTAMDAARTALRLGAAEVTIVYRRSESEITAAKDEIHEAMEENIKFQMLTGPKAILGEDGRVTGLACILNELGEPDASGRRRPVPIEGSEFVLAVDTVITAVGQSPDTTGLDNSGLNLGRGNTITADPINLATGIPGVFAAGDVVTGPATVIDAIGAGKKAAANIQLYLQGEALETSDSDQDKKIVPFPQHVAGDLDSPRTTPAYVDPEVRSKNFDESALGLSEVDGLTEAGRCLNCSVCSECLSCKEVCKATAINMGDEEITFDIKVGAVILSPGFETTDASALAYYGYGKFPNVLTSIEFERVLSASGPFQGHLVRPFDHKEPKKIAWIQCVGSRNKKEDHGYCSSVCCMYAVKEAVIAKEHSKDGLETSIFFMDMRTYGKDFEKYYERAKNEKDVNFIRSRIFEISELDDESKNLHIRYADENGTIHNDEFDMVILSLGMQPSKGAIDLGNRLGLDLNQYGFCETAPLTGVGTSRPGIFVAGAFGGPKDIPETVLQASAAAGASASLLGDVMGTLTKEREFPPEKDVAGQDPRVGVFVCNCGINIGGTVNVPEVVEVAKDLPNVVYSGEYLYVCSQDSQSAIKEAIDEHNLNRVVVASCSPRTHKALFQETCKEAGLNRYLFEMANIRDQCSWVHQGEPEKATAKAKDLVKMIVAKSTQLQPIKQPSAGVTKAALIIGGGISGMTSALSLADLGYEVHLMEKTDQLGGLAKRIWEGFRGEDIKAFVSGLINQVEQNELINVYLGTELKNVSGYVGNFVTTLSDEREIKHGVTIIAVGGKEYKPTEYLYGESDLVMTQLETEEAVANKDERIANAKNIVFIQCVGSREPGRNYCSRVCCNKTIKLSIKMKEMNPAANIFVLYRDIRTYGFMEDMYREARQKGVIFVRFTPDNKPQVEKVGDRVLVTVTDHVLGEPIVIDTDLLSLAAAIIPAEDNPRMNQLFKVPLNEDGFFLEAHMKLRPVDFSSEGVFMAGVAHGPKNIEENLCQAKAAAARACTILSKDALESHGVVAVVQPDKCAACLTCVRLCPYGAPRINNYAAEIESVICQGCGSCAGECPNKAITLQGYSDKMFMKMMDGLFKEVL